MIHCKEYIVDMSACISCGANVGEPCIIVRSSMLNNQTYEFTLQLVHEERIADFKDRIVEERRRNLLA